MGNIYTTSSANFAAPAAAVGSTAYTGCETTNVLDWLNPYKQFVATANTSGTTFVGLDLGAQTSLVGVFVDNLNLTSVKVQNGGSGSTPSWTATGESTVTVSLCRESGRYKFFIDLSAWNFRWLRVLSNTSSTTDSSGVMKVGSIVGVKSWDAGPWTMNPGFPFVRERVAPSIDDEGFGDRVAVNEGYARLTLSASMMPSTMRDTIQQFGGYGTTPLLFWLNDGNSQEAYIGRLMQQSTSVARTGPATVQMGAHVLREVG